MKVVYEKSVREKLQEVISTSFAQNRQIEKIILNRSEIEELKKEIFLPPVENWDDFRFWGIKIVVEK